MSWDFLVAKDDLAKTHIQDGPPIEGTELAAGDVLLEVERFALTANNITYGVVGERLGYWQFFSAPEGWGRIPAWGFARVTRSRANDIPEGLRLYGYLPMSTHLTTRLRRTSAGAADVSPHRLRLPSAYNSYAEAPESAADDKIAVMRPLFMTSFLLDDWLSENHDFDTDAILLASASSKTALGLAALLAARSKRVIGLTSERNRAFLESLDFFAEVATYGEIDRLTPTPAAFIDFAGDASVRRAIHQTYADLLKVSAIVGSTHHGAPTEGPQALPGPAPTFFFAPDRVDQRIRDWGRGAFDERITGALASFIDAATWLKVESHRGVEALAQAYADALAGRLDPAVAHIVRPS